jgi:hypothetical protein
MQRSIAAATPEGAGLRRLAPPRGLAALLVIIISVGLAWALLVPPWQAPDEIAQFAYAQSLAESFTLPGVPGHVQASSDEVLADDSVGASRGAFWPQTAPADWRRADYAAYVARERGRDRPAVADGAGPSTASGNPPLYYLFAAGAYLLDHGGTAFGRLYAIRIAGVLLLAVTTIAAWLLAGEVFRRRRLPQLTCAAVAALMPMVTFMSTAVNADALLIPLWTLDLWLGARVINHEARSHDVVGAAAITAAAVLTKATSYALVVSLLVAVLFGWLRRPAGQRRTGIGALPAAGLVLLIPVLGWVSFAPSLGGLSVTKVATSSAHPFNIRQFLSYIWQFYLPRLPFLTPFRTTAGLPVYDIWLKQGTGNFGWLSVFLPGWMYTAAAVVVSALAIASAGLVARLRGRRQLALLGFFALTLVALLGLLHITEYRTLIAGGGQFLQGRYLLPVIGLLGLAVGLIVVRTPRRARVWVSSVALVTLLAVQVISLATIVQAYYT